MTLAIVMELCRFGNLFKVIEYARRVQRLPPDVRSGATPPRTPEELKLRVRARAAERPDRVLCQACARAPAALAREEPEPLGRIPDARSVHWLMFCRMRSNATPPRTAEQPRVRS